MDFDYKTLMWDETADIGTLLHELDDAEFDRPSLCDDWRVRDVIGHMELGHTTPMPAIVKGLIHYRFNLTKGSFELSKQWGSEHAPDELRRIWDDELVGKHARKGISKTIKWNEAFLDHLIHHQDIRRPLGRPRQIAEHRVLAALEALPKVHTPLFSTRKRVEGIRLDATDVDFTCGDGPVVRGPGEALVLAAAGRTVALGELTGDGVAQLTDRLAAAA